MQEIRWRGSSCRYFHATGKRYKLFWMGSEARTEGVGIFVAEKWVDSVVSVERHSERIMVLKMVLGDCLLNVFTVYAPHSGKPDEVKECFSNEVMLDMMGHMVVLGTALGTQMVPGYWSLQMG